MVSSILNLRLPTAQQALLDQFGFDMPTWLALQAELAGGRFGVERNQMTEPVHPPQASDLVAWPTGETPHDKALIEQGQHALQSGQVAVAILNGGMATRFGGRVKGVVEVSGKQSFLALKLRHIAHVAPKAPVFLMNSFATQADTLAHLLTHQFFGLDPNQVHLVNQSISIRLTPDGAPFYTDGQQVSLYAPGHGDLLHAVGDAPAFQEFQARGGRYVAVSNVDNLAATLSPKVLGAHIQHRQPVTVEVAPKHPQDAGGAPVRRDDGHVMILEGFRFPANFPQETLPVFNTNTFVFDADALKPKYPLTWFRADKKVGGKPAVQFERLIGEVTSFVNATYLQVPREGAESRFLPVKTPEDLPGIVPWVQSYLKI